MLIIRAIVMLFILGTGCVQPEITSTPGNHVSVRPTDVVLRPTILPTLTPTAPASAIEIQIPYSKTSIWNTPIGSSPTYDYYSDEMIATLALANKGKIITADKYNYPVYFVYAETPRWDLQCTRYLCAISTADGGGVRTDFLEDVPIPVNAQPAADSDGRMIIIDKITRAEYDLWRVKLVEAGWTIESGSIYNIEWNGTPAVNNSRGSGIPAYGGLIRPWEIQQGRVEHAIAFGYTEPAEDKCVFPASKTDGDSRLPYAIPEGARLQLDPSLTDEDFDQWGLDRTGKIIARAFQKYGMILVDHSGSFKLYIEDLASNPFVTQQWTDPQLNLTRDTLSSIPYTSFRVLELPPGYWEASPNSIYHGKCLTFPGVP